MLDSWRDGKDGKLTFFNVVADEKTWILEI
jgi:hypothetical protein